MFQCIRCSKSQKSIQQNLIQNETEKKESEVQIDQNEAENNTNMQNSQINQNSILKKCKHKLPLSKQVSFDSVSTKCFDENFEIIDKNQKIVDFFYDKITQRNENSQPLTRQQYETKVIKKFMNLEDEKTIMIDIIWANNFTEYLQGLQNKISKIENSELLLRYKQDENLIEDQDYVNSQNQVLVNETTYDLLHKLYKGGPKIFKQVIPCIEQDLIVGLYNEDNYSYINSVVQAFINFKEVYRVQSRDQILCQNLRELLEDIQLLNSPAFHNPMNLKFYTDELDIRKDPIYFLKHILETIDQETMPIQINNNSNYFFINETFQNQVQVTYICQPCQTKQIQIKNKFFLALNIQEKFVTLEESIKSNFKNSHTSKKTCPLCQEPLLKFLKVIKIAPIVLIKIKTKKPYKLPNLVTNLHLNQQLVQFSLIGVEGQPLTFHLKSIISIDKIKTQFKAFCFKQQNWYSINDVKINQTNLSEINKENHKILFYELNI